MREARRSRWFGAARGVDAVALRAAAERRRSGPPGEDRWWHPADQVLAESELFDRLTLGKGWRPIQMVNNVERRRPLGDDPASEAVEVARSARVLTGLDEGRAWRHRDAGSLVVARSEVYADDALGAADAHRAAWHEHAEAALDATWRERWRERDRDPGWVEARWVRPDQQAGPVGPQLGPGCDWVRIEDHTESTASTRRRKDTQPGTVTVYQHLTVWGTRRQATIVIRHDVGLDLDDVVVRCAAEVERRMSASTA